MSVLFSYHLAVRIFQYSLNSNFDHFSWWKLDISIDDIKHKVLVDGIKNTYLYGCFFLRMKKWRRWRCLMRWSCERLTEKRERGGFMLLIFFGRGGERLKLARITRTSHLLWRRHPETKTRFESTAVRRFRPAWESWFFIISIMFPYCMIDHRYCN